MCKYVAVPLSSSRTHHVGLWARVPVSTTSLYFLQTPLPISYNITVLYQLLTLLLGGQRRATTWQQHSYFWQEEHCQSPGNDLHLRPHANASFCHTQGGVPGYRWGLCSQPNMAHRWAIFSLVAGPLSAVMYWDPQAICWCMYLHDA